MVEDGGWGGAELSKEYMWIYSCAVCLILCRSRTTVPCRIRPPGGGDQPCHNISLDVRFCQYRSDNSSTNSQCHHGTNIPLAYRTTNVTEYSGLDAEHPYIALHPFHIDEC